MSKAPGLYSVLHHWHTGNRALPTQSHFGPSQYILPNPLSALNDFGGQSNRRAIQQDRWYGQPVPGEPPQTVQISRSLKMYSQLEDNNGDTLLFLDKKSQISRRSAPNQEALTSKHSGDFRIARSTGAFSQRMDRHHKTHGVVASTYAFDPTTDQGIRQLAWKSKPKADGKSRFLKIRWETKGPTGQDNKAWGVIDANSILVLTSDNDAYRINLKRDQPTRFNPLAWIDLAYFQTKGKLRAKRSKYLYLPGDASIQKMRAITETQYDQVDFAVPGLNFNRPD